MKIGLVELPQLKLLDPNGKDWTEQNQHPLISKQILMSNLEAGGFEVELFNLKNGTQEELFGEANWKGMTLLKIAYGKAISSIDPESCDAWGVTNNFTIYRELTAFVLAHLAKGDKPIVVGGSDVIAQPNYYFQSGATVVVTDKSGAANWAIFDYVLGQPQRGTSINYHLAAFKRLEPLRSRCHSRKNLYFSRCPTGRTIGSTFCRWNRIS